MFQMDNAECAVMIYRKSKVEPVVDVASIVVQNLEKNVLLTELVHSSTNIIVGKLLSVIFHSHPPHMVVHVQDFCKSIFAKNICPTGEDCRCERTISAQPQSRKQFVVVVVIIILIITALEKSLIEMFLHLCMSIVWSELLHNVVGLSVLKKVETDAESYRQTERDDNEPPWMVSDESSDSFQTRSDWFLYTVCGEHHGDNEDMLEAVRWNLSHQFLMTCIYHFKPYLPTTCCYKASPT